MARLLAQRTGAVWLRVDTLEAAMLQAGLPLSYETGLAAYVGVRDQAREQLNVGRWVIIDAVNGVEDARSMWRDLSEELSVDRWVVELVCTNPSEHRTRVESRRPQTPPLPKPTWEEVRLREYVAWREPVLTLDPTLPIDDNLARILEYIEAPKLPVPGSEKVHPPP
jgi:hypothetical protein